MENYVGLNFDVWFDNGCGIFFICFLNGWEKINEIWISVNCKR